MICPSCHKKLDQDGKCRNTKCYWYRQRPYGEATLIDRWNDIDAFDPLPSMNDLASQAGIDLPLSAPGDRFERDQVDIAMYWPYVWVDK